ncbi:phage tail protein [Nitrobacter winogradskyi]|uniref:Microcystin-dependent protein n=2 Tax=Nitrobacter winogradskyi TaxID=913 RepID=A0ACC6AIU6_NITWI|nr:tail fiber protein [Nitrobacter winogradskyi]MCP1999413.1 microcystin-dependent protein [Nitrobacter winogradskyi]GEC14405.1 microcystin dependent protein [Nitrobacter winogradskyi]
MSEPYVGEIRLFGFSRVPQGWLPCDGSLLSISQYDVLFSLIGTTYGGDGVTTFAAPNLCGRAPVHYGAGPGLSPRALGEMSGTETVTLLSTQMPQHDHPMIVTTGAANTKAITPNVEFGAVVGDTMYTNDVTGAAAVATAPTSTSVAGRNVPHDNLMPTLTVQFCIAFNGIYPSRG